MNNKILSILVVIALFFGILGILLPKAIPAVTETLGGLIHNTREIFSEGIAGNGVTGNGLLSLGKVASTSISAADFCDYGFITLNPFEMDDADGASISLPTSATLIAKCLPNVGDTKTVVIENVATASARNFQINAYNTSEGDYKLFLNGGTALISNNYEMQIIKAIHLTTSTVSYQVIESTTD